VQVKRQGGGCMQQQKGEATDCRNHWFNWEEKKTCKEENLKLKKKTVDWKQFGWRGGLEPWLPILPSGVN